MKILCIYPHFGIAVYSISYAIAHLSKIGVESAVITSKMHTSKGSGKSKAYEVNEGIPIYRIYEDTKEQFAFPIRKYDKICAIVKEFKPDLIFCSHQSNMPIANQIKKDFHIPVVLFVEFTRNPFLLLGRRRHYLGIKKLAPFSANLYWRWLCRHSSSIITSNIGDEMYLKELSKYNTPVYYVPWCNQLPEDYSGLPRDSNKGIYVGLLSDSKNSTEFAKAIPQILENTPTKEFIFVGGGDDLYIIKQLQRRYGQKIKHIISLPRKNALKLIGSSYYSFTPVISGGLGFIGDSWAVKTPLIVTHNEYALNDRQDALIADNLDKVHHYVNELYQNRQLYETLQRESYRRYLKNHTAEAVGEKYYQIFYSVGKQKC